MEISVGTAPPASSMFMKSAETRKFLAAQYAEIRSMLTELGMAK